MTWTFRDPLTFPARYPSIMREAAAQPETPLLLASGARDHLEATAEQFRWYRWCLRHAGESALSRLEELYQFRTSIEDQFLYVSARSTNLQSLINLNPHLSPLISRECQ